MRVTAVHAARLFAPQSAENMCSVSRFRAVPVE
jgi:hypothetical protein